MSQVSISPTDVKALMRRAAYDARNAEPQKEAASQAAVQRLLEMPEYCRANTALWYIDCRSELRTRQALPRLLDSEKRIVVPYCTVDEAGANRLGLWRLESMGELAIGKWRIMEPPRERWNEAGKEIQPEEIDVAIVPGVAFSRRGGRMGNGQGYYDRLLTQVRSDCTLIGLCYECQLFDDLVVGPHDVFMDKIVTERAVYDGRGRN